MGKFRRLVFSVAAATMFIVAVPSQAATRAAPFDYGYMCGNFGVPVYGVPGAGYTCVADPQYVWVPPAFVGNVPNPVVGVSARSGVLAVGGWDYFCGYCVGVPAASGFLAGIYEAGVISYFSSPAGSSATVSSKIDPSAVRADQFERGLNVCLSVYEPVSYTTVATDCFGKGQAVRDLSVTFTAPSAPYGLWAKVTLNTSNDVGAAVVRVLEINVP